MNVHLDPFHLSRFVEAQEAVFDRALAQLTAGRKTSHWMWFVFPQIAGLGLSAMARRYGIGSLGEARAYLAHPVLGPRLVRCTEAMLAHENMSARDILGGLDSLKLRSCLTLFTAAGGGAPFETALARFFDGERDPATMALIGPSPSGERTEPAPPGAGR